MEEELLLKENIQQFRKSSEDSNFGDVMIVGGGISGIQAALDLANSGFKVYLVDKSPTIGGHMAQLDKTFPTNDCSMCIESPKFSEVNRHPNIECMTYTEVDSVEGEAGEFKVTLIKKPRYVIESKCTGCTVCVEYCPVKYPDQFNQEISQNKAIHIYFAQATPLVTYIDDSCLYLKEKRCTVCQGVCKAEAIDFNQKPEKVEINVGAIILSPGFEPVDPKLLRDDFGYGRFDNVVTSLDYERLLCATGPYEGEILRASDKKHPHKIAWINCVGSRQVISGGNSYCSAVCCTYTQKQIILTKDHDEDAECTVFHNDIRSYGKDFERFFQRTEKLPGVRFIRSYTSIGKEIPESKNVTIRYSTPEDGVKEEEFDMVVLSIGLNPPAEVKSLAEKFGIELNSHGFCKINPFNPMETSRRGIFVSGAFQGPVDIPESVLTASGAGSQCGQLLNYRRGALAKERIYPLERDVLGEEPKVGVYVCHCGANIGRVVDVPSTVEYSLTLPNVVHAEESLFICSTEAAQKLATSIKEKGLNRVVVAACTPRTHEPLFRDTLREAGINQYYYEMANIREHCSWVHSKEKEAATEKAKDLIRMSVARACQLEPLQEYDLPVNKTALVVGGGLAGMTSALSVANQGHAVHLVEKDTDLGGIARRIHYTLEGLDVQAYLRDVVQKVYQHPLIRVYHDATITEVSGYVGNFVTNVKYEGRVEEIKHGAAILATGAEVYQPTEYLYGEDDRVMTQLELEEQIAKREERVINSQSLVMIQCVGCRNEDRNYCSRICCSQSIKNALKLKEINPQMDVCILYRDMRTYGFKEDYYREAASKDVRFIRYEHQNKPQVEAVEEGGQRILRVTVADPILGQKLEIDADSIALAAAVIPSAGSQEATRLFKVASSPDGFFQEAHVKLRPVDFGAEGVYLCGIAHYPKHISEAISQAYGAAGRAVSLLSHDTVVASGSVCKVDESMCMGCGACISACTYGAIEFQETRQGKKAVVNPVLCKGDGLCNVKCPTGAIALKHYTDEELFNQIDAAVPEKITEQGFKPRIVGIICNWCCYGGADLAGVSRLQYPPHIRLIRVMCSGRVDLTHILRAFSNGEHAVFVGGCWTGDCHYITEGNYDALSMMHLGKKLLEHIGINPERLRIEWVSAGEGIRFANIMNEFSSNVKELGPLGKSEGIDENELKSKLAEIIKLVPYIKLAQSEKLAMHIRNNDQAYSELFTSDEIDALLRDVPSYYIDPGKCQACMSCARRCPAGAIISVKNQIHVVDQEKCIKCGTCLEACPSKFGAVMKISGEPVPPPIPEGERTIVRKI